MRPPRRNREQDWLKTNLAKFSGMMQGQRDLITLGHMLLSELAPLVNAQQGVMYVVETDGRRGRTRLRQLAGYADARDASTTPRTRRVRRGPDRPVRRAGADDPARRRAAGHRADRIRACSAPCRAA